MSDFTRPHEWFRDDVAITGYVDRSIRIASSDVVNPPWALRERGGYWRQYQPDQERNNASSQPVTAASGKETPSKSTSSSTA